MRPLTYFQTLCNLTVNRLLSPVFPSISNFLKIMKFFVSRNAWMCFEFHLSDPTESTSFLLLCPRFKCDDGVVNDNAPLISHSNPVLSTCEMFSIKLYLVLEMVTQILFFLQ